MTDVTYEHERIMVPLDGSKAAEAALGFAELIPSTCARLLQVEPDVAGPMLASAPEVEAWCTAREKEARVYLDQVAIGLRQQGQSVDRTFGFSDPATRIIEGANDTDLLVMTTHGRGAGGRILFGSVADRVARHALAATLLVRAGKHPASPPPVSRIVVPLDGSPVGELAIPVAMGIAGDLGLDLHLVRVAGERWTPGSAEGSEAEEYVSVWARRLQDENVSVTVEVWIGAPAIALLNALRRGDLVVITTHGHGGLRRWLLGSVAERVVRAESGPVLLVRAIAASAA
jgi:nucleotide-binding universal stress UspA family protein